MIRAKRICAVMAFIGILSALVVGSSFTSAAAQTLPELTQVQERFDGTLSGVVVRENSGVGPYYNFYPNKDTGRVSVYAQEDPSYGSVPYSITNQFTIPMVNLQNEALFYLFGDLSVSCSFVVYAELGFGTSTDIANALWARLTSGGQQIKINNRVIPCYVTDLLVHRDLEYGQSAYVATMTLGVDWSQIDSETVFSCFNDGRATVFFQFTSWFKTATYADNIMTMGNFKAWISTNYYITDPNDRPLPPSATESMDNMSDAADDLSSVGGSIGNAADDLESMTPSIGDPFAGAPGAGDYATGSDFFTQLFNFLYVNEVTGAFISFGLIMALVVFIMRR